MSVFKSSEAKKSGFAQVREALQSFEGTVVRAEAGQWGGKLVDDEGKPLPPKEMFEIECIDNVPLKTTEELSMDISNKFSFRVNMSDKAGSYWIDEFVTSAEKAGVPLPDGLKGKRIIWKKVTRTWDINGVERSYSNFVIDKVKDDKEKTSTSPAPAKNEPFDPMKAALELAVGKTEQQFRTAIGIDSRFANHPILSAAKAGALTQSFLKEGKLVLVDNKYQLPK